MGSHVIELNQEAGFIPQSQDLRPNHDENGKFAPGNRANPGGRIVFTSITDAYRALLRNGGAEKLAAVIFNDALTARRAQDRRAAAAEITDRVEGRAVQAVRLEQTLDAGTARAIANLASVFVPKQLADGGANSPLIEPIEEPKRDE